MKSRSDNKQLSFDLYLDDSGTRYPDHRGASRLDGMDYFALGGLILRSECVGEVIEAHRGLCSEFGISAPLHSNSIRVRKGPFAWLERDPLRAQSFMQRLSSLLTALPGVATACVVHRPGYNVRYREKYGSRRWDLCKSAYPIVVERAAKYAAANGRRLHVFIEQVGKKEDRAIADYHSTMRSKGMYFDAVNSAKYNPMETKALAETLFSRPNFIQKQNPLAQIADLLLYPLVKGKYDPEYMPYKMLRDAKRVVDDVVPAERLAELGVKYYCFDAAF